MVINRSLSVVVVVLVAVSTVLRFDFCCLSFCVVAAVVTSVGLDRLYPSM